MTKPVMITGPVGRLEGLLARAQRTTRRAVVMCHPHPQFGGNMHDSVLEAVSKALLVEGVDCLRFNFRGVGNSSGVFDNGVGETDDTLAVMAFARDSLNTDEIWLADYSFGAGVAWHGAPRKRPTTLTGCCCRATECAHGFRRRRAQHPGARVCGFR